MDQPITVRGEPGAIFDGGLALQQFIILKDVHDLIFENIEVRRYHPAQNGVWLIIEGARNITIREVKMHGCTQSNQGGTANEHLLYLGGGVLGNITIEDSDLDVRGLNGAGIHMYHEPGFSGVTIQRNAITGDATIQTTNPYSPNWAIIVAQHTSDVRVLDNTFIGAWRKHQIQLWYPDATYTVTGNSPSDAYIP